MSSDMMEWTSRKVSTYLQEFARQKNVILAKLEVGLSGNQVRKLLYALCSKIVGLLG